MIRGPSKNFSRLDLDQNGHANCFYCDATLVVAERQNAHSSSENTATASRCASVPGHRLDRCLGGHHWRDSGCLGAFVLIADGNPVAAAFVLIAVAAIIAVVLHESAHAPPD